MRPHAGATSELDKSARSVQAAGSLGSSRCSVQSILYGAGRPSGEASDGCATLKILMSTDYENLAADRLADDVASAKDALIEVAESEPGRWWRAAELKTRARNGWDPGAMSIAMAELIDEERFQVGDRLHVRLTRP
jgi:hypothetical protein